MLPLKDSQVDNLQVSHISQTSRSKTIKKPWTLEEDERIRELVHENGAKNWTRIAKNIPDRLGKQCRERWYNHLDPNIRKDGWTEDEEWILYLLHRRKGNKWAELSKYLPGRTDNSIKNHWNSIMRKRMAYFNDQVKQIREIKNPSFIKNTPQFQDIENQCIEELRVSLPILKKKPSSSQNSAWLERKVSSPSHKLTYTRLQKKTSSSSYAGLISPSHLMDSDLFKAYNEDSLEHNLVQPFETPAKCDINIIDQQIPVGLFRNFSLKQSQNGQEQPEGNLKILEKKSEQDDSMMLMVSPGRFIHRSSTKR